MGSKRRGPGRHALGAGSAELELAINQVAADQAAVRIILQSFLLRLFATRPATALTAFAELQDHVLRSIEAIPLAPDDEIGAARWKRLVSASAEKMLGEITDTMGEPVDDGGGRAARQSKIASA